MSVEKQLEKTENRRRGAGGIVCGAFLAFR